MAGMKAEAVCALISTQTSARGNLVDSSNARVSYRK